MFRGKGKPLCRNVRGMLSEYIDNGLDSENKSFVEHHLETCEACSKELESLRMTVQLLHRVPEVPAPRSFTVVVPEPRREGAFGPASLRWLRPATAIVAVALVVLLMGDFLHGFENNVRSNSGPGDLTFSGVQLAPSSAAEQQPMVAVPGVMGQMSLATAKAVGYTDYTVLPSSPVSQSIAQPVPTVLGNEGISNEGPTGARVTVAGEAGVSWPLRQIEIGLGAAVFILLALVVFARKARRNEASGR
jgi:hypothetical protein